MGESERQKTGQQTVEENCLCFLERVFSSLGAKQQVLLDSKNFFHKITEWTTKNFFDTNKKGKQESQKNHPNEGLSLSLYSMEPKGGASGSAEVLL